jgi:hypothetical protein
MKQYAGVIELVHRKAIDSTRGPEMSFRGNTPMAASPTVPGEPSQADHARYHASDIP